MEVVAHRRVSTRTYIMAGVITFLVLVLGISLGMTFDNERVRALSAENRAQELDGQSLQLQYLMLNWLATSDNRTCGLLKVTLEESIRSLHTSLAKVQEYSKQTAFNGQEFEFLQRKYILDNIQYWQFLKRANRECGVDAVPILYFFSGKHCDVCVNQGVILTYFKNRFGDRVLVFPIDVDFEGKERMISLLRNAFGITDVPAIVVDDTPFVGSVVQKDELLKELCDWYSDPPADCAEVAGVVA